MNITKLIDNGQGALSMTNEALEGAQGRKNWIDAIFLSELLFPH